MSPEQAQGQPIDARSDIFSLGIVLYEMTTGRRPFTGANPISILSSILRDTPPPVTELAPSAPAPLDRIVARCLEKDPAARYADATTIRDDLLSLRSDSGSGLHLAASPRKRRWLMAAAAVALLAFIALAAWMYQRQRTRRWVQRDALPQLAAITNRIQTFEEGRESWDAFLLSRKIDEVTRSEPLVEQLRGRFTRPISITSDPPGATVSVRYYDEPDATPIILGKTPLEKVGFPRGFTRVRVELPGRRPVEDVIWNVVMIGDAFAYRLHRPGELPEEMERVAAGKFDLYMPGLDHLQAEPLQDFFMDRHEVTNRDYKRFVDAGGYRDPRFWRHPFIEGTQTWTWPEAMRRLVDRTGRPGPSTWEVGSYPEGQENLPVAGVSWYEAAAFAEWAGKSLPTIFHWNRAAFTPASSRIVPLSNLGGTGLVPVGSTKSTNRFGISDLAGNVREWTWNAAGGDGARYILGGAWNDADWAFSDAYAQPPLDRSATNGFRCIRMVGKEPNLARLQRTIAREFRDFSTEKPVSDAVFAQYLRQFTYDRVPLDARIEEEKPTALGMRQKITFDAAYGSERMAAYLFLPTSGRPPYQVVVLFPGSHSLKARSSAELDAARADFLLKSGRALLWPIYKGTYERGGELESDYPEPTASYRDYVIMWGKDLARSIDYVETRKDLDAGRIAYYGISWGGAMGAIMPAVEPRIKANVLYVAGLNFQRALPEVDAINYVGRVRQPTLLLNGEFDFYFPPETSQRPMFELLGTPPAHKKRLVFPGGHSVPRTETIKEALQWLDRYLGPV
jgi:pimeloyl-ACP methyl ester carboxylesterase